MKKLPTPDLEMQDAILYTNLILLVLVLFLVSFIIYVIYRTYKAEQKRKAYNPTMGQGDKVCTPVMSGNVRGEILEVNEDKVKMIIEVPRSRVYPDEGKSR
jgi:preprotein translocase subunit YajC